MWQAVIAAAFLFLPSGLSYSGDAPADDWKAPRARRRNRIRFPPDADAIAAGKKIYARQLPGLPWRRGKGDGPAAIACNPRPKDLSDPKISSQADGELFWKITEGKKPMPTYEKLLSETDRWKVIDYIRTLAPRPPATAPSGA